jgi:hypothetical protein
VSDDKKRTNLIAGLRGLADFIEQHPDFPLPTFPEFAHCATARDDEAGVAEVRQISAALGAEMTVEPDGDARVTFHFAGLRYRAFYVSRDRSRQWDEDMEFVRRRHAAEVTP